MDFVKLVYMENNIDFPSLHLTNMLITNWILSTQMSVGHYCSVLAESATLLHSLMTTLAKYDYTPFTTKVNPLLSFMNSRHKPNFNQDVN